MCRQLRSTDIKRREHFAYAFACVSWPSSVGLGRGYPTSDQRFQRFKFVNRQPRESAIRMSLETTDSLLGAVDGGVEWAKLNNGKVSDLLDFSKMDVRSRRGVILSQRKSNILKGTELAQLPEGSFLSASLAKKLLQKECDVSLDPTLNLGDEAMFALCLLVEHAKGENSSYFGLLQALPQVGDLDSPDLWSIGELKVLQGSPVYSKSIEIREAIEKEWKVLNERVFEANRSIFPLEQFSLDMYRWALGIVDSRTVSAGSAEPKVLAPVLQNLRPPAGGSKATGRVTTSGGSFFGKKRVVLSLDKDVCGGDEVSFASGQGFCNSDYLLERGEVVKDGASKFEMRFELAQLDRFYEDKVDILEMVGMEASASFDMVEADEKGKWEAPRKMEEYLRLLCLSGADAFLLEGVFRGEVWDFMELPVSEENEKGMCEVMIGACEDALEGYWNGEVENVCARRREMGRIVVEGEKRILEAAMKMFKSRLSSLDALEYYAERRLRTLDLLRAVDESEIVDSESGGRIGRAFDENF